MTVRNTLTRLTVTGTACAAALTAVPASAAPGDQFGPTHIVNSVTGGHLVPDGLGNNRNDGIYMWAWNASSAGGQWTFEEVRGAHYLIRNTATGKCLKPGGQYGAKTYVTQATCNDGYEFQWSLERRSFNLEDVKIVSRSSRQAMRPYQNAANQVVVLDSNSNTAANWWSLGDL